jgi:hypothetical protein
VLPRMAQDFEVVRHRVVAEAEHDAVKRLARNVCKRVALGQLDILPLLTPAKRSCPAQHPARQVDPIDFAAGSDRCVQERKIAPGAASDFQHAVARVEPQTRRRALAQVRREEQQAVEQADQAGDSIVSLCDERGFAIHPLVVHVLRPDTGADCSCLLPPASLEMFPSLDDLSVLEVAIVETQTCGCSMGKNRWQIVALFCRCSDDRPLPHAFAQSGRSDARACAMQKDVSWVKAALTRSAAPLVLG